MASKKKPSKAELEIFSRIVRPEKPLPPLVASALLDLEFAAEDRQRMHELARRANAGDLTRDEKHEADVYELAGLLLDLLRLKARRSLARAKEKA